MRGKDYNVGLRGVLFEAAHYERMGAALWLYGWLVLRQTRQQGELGWVLGGAPVSYREIEEETGFNCRTLERWMHRLRREGYIETEAAPSGVIVRITKAKKFPQGARATAYTGRNPAEHPAQFRVPGRSKVPSNQKAADGIGSSFLERSNKRTPSRDFHSDFHNPVPPKRQNLNANSFRLGQTQSTPAIPEDDLMASAHVEAQRRFIAEAQLRLQLLRAEREEAVRRELAVGTGPEVKRS
jgi:hypothetical protein